MDRYGPNKSRQLDYFEDREIVPRSHLVVAWIDPTVSRLFEAVAMAEEETEDIGWRRTTSVVVALTRSRSRSSCVLRLRRGARHKPIMIVPLYNYALSRLRWT